MTVRTRTWVAAFAFVAAALQLLELIAGLTAQIGIGDPAASADKIRTYHSSHANAIFALTAVDVVWTIAIIGFTLMLWRILHERDGVKFHKWATESLIALAAFAVLNLASDATSIALAASRYPDAMTVTLFRASIVLSVATDFPLALLLIVLSGDLRRASIVTGWLYRLGMIAAGSLLIGELWIFPTSADLQGAMQVFTLWGTVGFIVWLAALGARMLADVSP